MDSHDDAGKAAASVFCILKTTVSRVSWELEIIDRGLHNILVDESSKGRPLLYVDNLTASMAASTMSVM